MRKEICAHLRNGSHRVLNERACRRGTIALAAQSVHEGRPPPGIIQHYGWLVGWFCCFGPPRGAGLVLPFVNGRVRPLASEKFSTQLCRNPDPTKGGANPKKTTKAYVH